MTLVVEGNVESSVEAAVFQSDGELPPFVIFDDVKQRYLPGHWDTRADAELALDGINTKASREMEQRLMAAQAAPVYEMQTTMRVDQKDALRVVCMACELVGDQHVSFAVVDNEGGEGITLVLESGLKEVPDLRIELRPNGKWKAFVITTLEAERM